MTSDPDLAALAERLGYSFTQPSLLVEAVTHRSWCADHAGASSNERLEFLGDAVLALVVTDHVYAAYPQMAEGQLAPLRAEVVRAETLADLAVELQLGKALRLGRGEEASGGREKQSILSDAMEAVIGAVYLDAPWEVLTDLVRGWLADRIAAAAEGPGIRDFKTRLQEYCARSGLDAPEYRLSEKGPDHAKQFLAVVYMNGVERGRGKGRSKKQAEQAAAASSWQSLDSGAVAAGAGAAS
ncbi:ribonuclease III [Candidatus Poriferisocius sp.]|uniref:ribonuclease III n=1 Tax=Candidatus Poriferisocius sp. TaxID=3101276 RepID=UPI003B01229D